MICQKRPGFMFVRIWGHEIPWLVDSGLVGEVPRGEKMLYSGADPESYTVVYEDNTLITAGVDRAGGGALRPLLHGSPRPLVPLVMSLQPRVG